MCRELRAAQVPSDLPAHLREGVLELGAVDGVLAKHDLSHDRLDVAALQLDLHREAVLEAGQHLVGRQRRLAGGDHEEPALELARESLDDVLHLQQELDVIAEVLLHLVDDEQGQREVGPVSVLGVAGDALRAPP